MENNNCIIENTAFDKKSLSTIMGKNPRWKLLARDCVGFANTRGGVIDIGIEDNASEPPQNQTIDSNSVETLRKRINELTINTGIDVQTKKYPNGGECIRIKIFPSLNSIASTTDGQYYIRISDQCKPVHPDELSRLFTDKSAFVWETKVFQKVEIRDCDTQKLDLFIKDIRKSTRASDFVKAKSEIELLEYYQMYNGRFLTNLGILWVGTQQQRAGLQYAPIVQFIKYDDRGMKTYKKMWDDYSLNPKELIDEIWNKIQEWKEGTEISEGIFGRRIIYHYSEDVIREVLSNALVHKPYTTRGDIFINYYPDRVEIWNPGLLPLGVTPENILHQSVSRNIHLSKIFYDLNLMEREGSGYDKIYEIQLKEAKRLPIVEEFEDSVKITLFKGIKNPDIIKLINEVNYTYLLSQKEIISLGIIMQSESILATEFTKMIQVKDDKQLKHWLGKLLKHAIIKKKGKTKGTEYFVNPEILKGTKFEITNLRKIEPHRLKQLLIEDITNYHSSSIKEIHQRIGEEIPIRKVRRVLYDLVKRGEIRHSGGKKNRKYFIDQNNREK